MLFAKAIALDVLSLTTWVFAQMFVAKAVLRLGLVTAAAFQTGAVRVHLGRMTFSFIQFFMRSKVWTPQPDPYKSTQLTPTPKQSLNTQPHKHPQPKQSPTTNLN